MAEYLPQKLGQNYIDYIMKQYQVWIDAIFGSENDNSDAVYADPLTFSGMTGFLIDVNWSGVNRSYVLRATANINIGKDNDGNVISGHTLRQEMTGSWASSMPQVHAWFNSSNWFCDMWGGYKKSPTINNKWYFQSVDYDNAEINANYVLNKNGTQDYSEQPFLYPDVYNTSDLSLSSDGGLSGSGALMSIGGGYLGAPVVNVPSFTNSPNIKNISTSLDGYNSTTYVTNSGDTIGITYNSYAVNIGSAGLPISYDDIYNIFAGIIIPSLPDGQNTLIVPTYDDIKYEDMGDFYIQPLHQYDTIPSAPTFDGTIDLGNYPTVLAESANTFLNFMPVTLSALFTAAFVVCVLLRKLGR